MSNVEIVKFGTEDWQEVEAVKRSPVFRDVVQTEAELAYWRMRESEARAHMAVGRRALKAARRNLRIAERQHQVRSDVFGDLLADKGWIRRLSLVAPVGVVAGIVMGVALYVHGGRAAEMNPLPMALPALAAEVAAPAEQVPPAAKMALPPAEKLGEYLASKNPELAGCADQLLKHDRWQLAVAIAGHETGYCTRGVARHNNCGGIKSGRADREWKSYANKCDGLEDIAYLIEKPRYAGLTVGQMNGIYCQQDGGKCDGWTEGVNHFIEQINQYERSAD